MKRIGYFLLAAVALLVIFTIAVAQLEARGARQLLRVFSGDEVRGYFGSAVAGSAWTGEGTMIAVSATGEENGPVRRGKIMFFDSLLADKPSAVITGPEEGDLFGRTMSGGGDFNGDGFPDLAVGAPYTPGGREKSNPGVVYLYFGGSDFTDGPDAKLTAGEKGDGFGSTVDLTNDVNGDGLADLIVGAPLSEKSGSTAGRAYVWFGTGSEEIPDSPSAEVRLGTTNDLFGSSVSSGDLNGDGAADVVIGSPQHNLGGKIPGSVFVFFGGESVNFSKPSKVLNGESTSFQDQFGRSVAVIEDINGDGKSELLVGAPQVVYEDKQLGKVYLYYGDDDISSEPVQMMWGKVEAGRFGQTVHALGDVNRDGKGDWAVQAESESGARGVLYLFYGGWEREFQKFSGEQTGDRLGDCLSVLGDMDGNGSVEVIVGARWNDSDFENAGRAYILTLD